MFPDVHLQKVEISWGGWFSEWGSVDLSGRVGVRVFMYVCVHLTDAGWGPVINCTDVDFLF